MRWYDWTALAMVGIVAVVLPALLFSSAACRSRSIQPKEVVTVCSGCGMEWHSMDGTPSKPITKCPNCPMSEEEWEALKEQMRKRTEKTPSKHSARSPWPRALRCALNGEQASPQAQRGPTTARRRWDGGTGMAANSVDSLAETGTMAGMSDRIPFVGGPIEGQDYPATTPRAVFVPDARDWVSVVNPDGYSGMVFGRHTYERRSYSDGTERLVHVRYERPVLVSGKAVYEKVEWQPLQR